MGGGCECQQGVAVHSKQDGVDQGYTGNGEAHSLEEAQDLQSDIVTPCEAWWALPPTSSSGQASAICISLLLEPCPRHTQQMEEAGRASTPLLGCQATARWKQALRAQITPTPKKWATYRLMAVSLEYAVHNALVCVLGL